MTGWRQVAVSEPAEDVSDTDLAAGGATYTLARLASAARLWRVEQREGTTGGGPAAPRRHLLVLSACAALLAGTAAAAVGVQAFRDASSLGPRRSAGLTDARPESKEEYSVSSPSLNEQSGGDGGKGGDRGDDDFAARQEYSGADGATFATAAPSDEGSRAARGWPQIGATGASSSSASASYADGAGTGQQQQQQQQQQLGLRSSAAAESAVMQQEVAPSAVAASSALQGGPQQQEVTPSAVGVSSALQGGPQQQAFADDGSSGTAYAEASSAGLSQGVTQDASSETAAGTAASSLDPSSSAGALRGTVRQPESAGSRAGEAYGGGAKVEVWSRHVPSGESAGRSGDSIAVGKEFRSASSLQQADSNSAEAETWSQQAAGGDSAGRGSDSITVGDAAESWSQQADSHSAEAESWSRQAAGGDSAGRGSDSITVGKEFSSESSLQQVYGSQPTTPMLLQQVSGAYATSTAAPSTCGLVSDGINYPGNDISQVTNISSPDLCCQVCATVPSCVAWTWGKERGESFTDICYLKGATPKTSLTEVEDKKFVSGQPTQVGRSIPVSKPWPGLSLFCFSLMLPWGYEQSLLRLQYDRGSSIFACNEYAIYSNQKLEPAPGVQTYVVDSSLKCEKGGEFMTALNTPIFMKLWAQIVSDGRFHFHDWTVKVDPDSVFFPSRLRSLLPKHKPGKKGVYLNNCRHGLHGPLEVFSTKAVVTWAKGAERCTQHFNKLCSGPCAWGEDLFIDQCLWKVLEVKREDEPFMLLEDHCDPPEGWDDCKNTSFTAYHPFKSVEGYRKCMDGAIGVPAGMLSGFSSSGSSNQALVSVAK